MSKNTPNNIIALSNPPPQLEQAIIGDTGNSFNIIILFLNKDGQIFAKTLKQTLI